MHATLDNSAIIAAIQRVVGSAKQPVPLHEPFFGGREWEYVKECIDTGWVSSAGKFVDRFEKELARATGTAFAVATANGTAALQVALHLAGVQRDDEVIVPTLTFIATANAVSHCGAIPHFVDSSESNLGLDPLKLERHLEKIAVRDHGTLRNRETGRPIRAVVPVHVFGHPVALDKLIEVCGAFGLPVIEDATESLGSTYRDRPCGGFGLLGTLSFNGNKIVTTGGGGAIVTNDERLARRAKHLTTTAKLPHPWAFEHDEVGWNYRLPNLNAALGSAQLEQLPDFVAAKRRVANAYAGAFADVPGLTMLRDEPHTRSNYWLNAILLDDDSGEARDALLRDTHAAGLLTRPVWTPLHTLGMYRSCPRGDLGIAESIARRLVNLPSSAILGMASE